MCYTSVCVCVCLNVFRVEMVCLSFLPINSKVSKHGSSDLPTKAVLAVKGEAFIDLLTTAPEHIGQLPITVKSAQVFCWTPTSSNFPSQFYELFVLIASDIFVLSLSMVRVSPFPVCLSLVRGLHDLHHFTLGLLLCPSPHPCHPLPVALLASTVTSLSSVSGSSRTYSSIYGRLTD